MFKIALMLEQADRTVLKTVDGKSYEFESRWEHYTKIGIKLLEVFMTKEEKLNLKKIRLATLEARGEKNIKCGGVLRKLRREIRNLEN